jgi:transcriptional regulator with XRE-family HTH domain
MEDNPGKIVAHRVHARRKALGWTQEILAQHAGLRQSAIARIESGKNRNIETNTLMALARALDVSLEYLVGMEERCGAVSE